VTAERPVKELIDYIMFPDASIDNYKLISLVERAFEDMTGMSPLLVGNMGETQMRSGSEAQIRDARAMTRPEQFRQKCREWHSLIARKEGIASRLYTAPSVIAPLAGEPPPEFDSDGKPIGNLGPLTHLWSTLWNTPDPYQACAEVDYSIEVGTDTPKNKNKEQADFQQVGQVIVPGLLNFAAQGVTQPWNAFIRWMSEVYEVRLDDMMLPVMPPAPPPGAGGEQPQQEQGPA